jgi:hypothetical protein
LEAWSFVSIKTIPLNRLEENPLATLNECADSGQAYVIQLPDQRLITIQALDPADDESLVDELLQTNPAFQALVTKSKQSTRKPFGTSA